MNASIYDLLARLRFADVPNKQISIGVPPRQRVPGVSYHLDMVDCGPHPYESVLLRIEALHRLSSEDRVLPLAIADVEEGIDVCRQFCIEQELPFTESDEAALRKNAEGNVRLLLYIIERPV